MSDEASPRPRTPADLDINEWQGMLDRFQSNKPYAAFRIENTPFTTARHAGGMTFGGDSYGRLPEEMLLPKCDDDAALALKEANK